MGVKKDVNSLRSWKLKRTLGCWRYQAFCKPIVLREAHNSLFNSPFNSPFIAYAAVD